MLMITCLLLEYVDHHDDVVIQIYPRFESLMFDSLTHQISLSSERIINYLDTLTLN